MEILLGLGGRNIKRKRRNLSLSLNILPFIPYLNKKVVCFQANGHWRAMGNIVSYFTKPAAAAVKNGEVAREDSEVPVLTSVQKIVDEAPAADNVVSKYTWLVATPKSFQTTLFHMAINLSWH